MKGRNRYSQWTNERKKQTKERNKRKKETNDRPFFVGQASDETDFILTGKETLNCFFKNFHYNMIICFYQNAHNLNIIVLLVNRTKLKIRNKKIRSK